MNGPVDRVVAALRAGGVEAEVRRFDVPVPTAAVAAEVLACAVGAIANSLVFAADGEPLMVLASGAHRVDTGKVAALVGAEKVRRASPEFVLAVTGQEVGGVAPVGHPAPLRTHPRQVLAITSAPPASEREDDLPGRAALEHPLEPPGPGRAAARRRSAGGCR